MKRQGLSFTMQKNKVIYKIHFTLSVKFVSCADKGIEVVMFEKYNIRIFKQCAFWVQDAVSYRELTKAFFRVDCYRYY